VGVSDLAKSVERMDRVVYKRMLVWGVFLLSCALVFKLQAGGGGLNTIVIVNQTSSNSCELGNYFCEHRQVPPSNVLRINWSGGNTSWTSNDFQTLLLTPLLDMLAARQLTNQIDYVVLSMDIPFQTSFGPAVNGTTSALFYGSRLGNGSDVLGVTNSYAASEAIFRLATPVGAPGYSFLATMITGDSIAHAEQLVDQGVNGDRSYPQQPVVLAKSSDSARNIRFYSFDNAIFNVNILGVSTILRTNTDSLWVQNGFLGYETGLAQFNLSPGTFVPGAIGDSLTSFGGIIFGSNDQTNLLAFVNAGAAGSYGTVAEPSNDTQKFPNPQVYFYQARGFSLAECYYQSINAPYLGLTVAEPLAAPFASPGAGEWGEGISNSILSGTASLSVQLSAWDGGHPLQQADLFVDGAYFSTLTNLAPCPGNQLTVNLKGYPIMYTVPTNATLGTIATGLTASINDPATTNITKVIAFVHGDRIELRSMAADISTFPFYVADTTSTNSSGSSYSVSYLPESFPPQITPVGIQSSGAFQMELGVPTPLHYVIQASTNLVDWLPIFTNVMPGLVDFQDSDATNYSARFYRVVGPVPDQPPRLSAPGLDGNGAFQFNMDSEPGQPCAIQVSTNLVDWVPVLTNQLGGGMVFVDTTSTNAVSRLYRAWRVPPTPPAFTVLAASNGVNLVRIDSAVLPFTVQVSTNQGLWTPIVTNFSLSDNQVAASSAVGNAPVLTTFLSASLPTFLTSSAFGMQGYTVIGNSPPANAYIQFTFTKTNGQVVAVAVTNQSGGTSGALAAQVYASINTNAALQGSDGVVAEDYVVNPGSIITFNLRARSPGYQAAGIQVIPKVYRVIMSTPQGALTLNLSDLQSRDHLYVTAGATSLDLPFPLDTTTLADGYHELTAVAYEGSSVRTQTRVTVPVWIQNSSLSATMTLPDLPDPAFVQDTFTVHVEANTNTVSLITLYSTGGALDMATNNPAPDFQVNGTNLWAGLHPFYALVETGDGLKYRTETHWVRLVNGP
jgi:uncharacterized protein (TIGR03790 family)